MIYLKQENVLEPLVNDANSVDRQTIIDIIYPVGSIYLQVVGSPKPEIIFGGVWEQIKDKFILASGDAFSPGETGGALSFQLTTANLPAHSHTFTGTAISHSHTISVANKAAFNTSSTSIAHTHTATTSSAGNHKHNTQKAKALQLSSALAQSVEKDSFSKS